MAGKAKSAVKRMARIIATTQGFPMELAEAAARDWLKQIAKMDNYQTLDAESRDTVRKLFLNGWIAGHIYRPIPRWLAN